MRSLFLGARPLLRYSLAFFWLVSAIAGVFDLRGWGVLLVTKLPIGMGTALAVLAAACLINAAIALLVFRAWRPRRLATVQFFLVLAYTAIATILFPSLWMEPLGPLLKNVPLLGATIAWGAMEEPSR